jgi:hypothetical protein
MPACGLEPWLQTVFGGQGGAVDPTVLPHVEDVVVHTSRQIPAEAPRALRREQVHPDPQKALDLGLVVGEGEIPRDLGGEGLYGQGKLYRPAACSVLHVFVHHMRFLL